MKKNGLQSNKKSMPRPHESIDLMDYDADFIVEKLNNFQILRKGNEVCTFYFNRLISKRICSDKYGVFDFSNFVISTLPAIEDIFNPKFFNLKIERGIQELKLFGEEVIINDQLYKKMFTVFSSSNGYYPLIINGCLFRQVCSNGMMASVGGSQFNIRTRHYVKSISENVKSIELNLPLVEADISRQIAFLKETAGRNISFLTCISKLIKKTENEELVTMFAIAKRLGKNLLESQTDLLDSGILKDSQKSSLMDPKGLLNGLVGFEDLNVPVIKIYNCYTEIFRFRNTAIIERENRRIAEVLSS